MMEQKMPPNDVKMARRLDKMLQGRVVKDIRQDRLDMVCITFACGTRLYVDSKTPLEFSVTGDFAEDF